MDWSEYFEYRDGELFWLVNTGKRRLIGLSAGVLTRGYIQIKCQGKQAFAHRVIWEMFHGCIPPGVFIDHIDHNRSNNKIDNLRLVTKQQNNMNRSINKENPYGYKGVYWRPDKGRFKAAIRHNSKDNFLGYYDTKEEAAAAYNTAAIEKFGQYAVLNVLED